MGPTVAIVGPRKASEYGVQIAGELAHGLVARGICVVSGLAYGIDGAANAAALKAGGRTVAVLGCGAGRTSIPLAELGLTVTGIDISQRMVDLARQQAQLAGVHAKASGDVVRSVALVAERTARLVEKLNSAVEQEAFRLPETRNFDEGSDVRVLFDEDGNKVLDAEEIRGVFANAGTPIAQADAEALHAQGLALGASLENTIVLDSHGVMNDSLRFKDEFLRHKVGDIVGDLALLGARLNAHIVVERPSHTGNVKLARAIRLDNQ